MGPKGMTLKVKSGLLGLVKHSNLVETGFGINTDPVELACDWGEVVNGFVTVRYGKIVHTGERVEAMVGDSKAPHEVGNVGGMLLAGFWGKDNYREPTGEVGKRLIQFMLSKSCNCCRMILVS